MSARGHEQKNSQRARGEHGRCRRSHHILSYQWHSPPFSQVPKSLVFRGALSTRDAPRSGHAVAFCRSCAAEGETVDNGVAIRAADRFIRWLRNDRSFMVMSFFADVGHVPCVTSLPANRLDPNCGSHLPVAEIRSERQPDTFNLVRSLGRRLLCSATRRGFP
jgi:hypothetical protein